MSGVDAAPAAPAPDPVDVLARTLWGEARGEGEAGMEAVAAVVLNRVEVSARLGGRHWWGHDVVSVCRCKAQFSCWNPGDPNRSKLLAADDRDASFRLAKSVAERAIAGQIHDPTCGATTYKVASLPWPYSWGRPRLPLATIGHHEFYNLEID
jgi:spore germination cell wall hydrolase CwlJ-like protein